MLLVLGDLSERIGLLEINFIKLQNPKHRRRDLSPAWNRAQLEEYQIENDSKLKKLDTRVRQNEAKWNKSQKAKQRRRDLSLARVRTQFEEYKSGSDARIRQLEAKVDNNTTISRGMDKRLSKLENKSRDTANDKEDVVIQDVKKPQRQRTKIGNPTTKQKSRKNKKRLSLFPDILTFQL